MAHATKLGGLTEELVTIITAFSAQNDARKFNRLKDSALRSLRHHNHGRTNQFDVESQYEGLVEKFEVLNREALADALSRRLKLLDGLHVKWQPEILHFLLELSDQPVFHTKLEDVEITYEQESDTGTPLRWNDLRAEDPLLREKSVWRNVDFAAGSSEDEFDDTSSDLSDPTTVETSPENDLHQHPLQTVVETPNHSGLKALRKAQYWLHAPSVGGVELETVKKQITDLQATREIIFMLTGLPTSLFKVSPATGSAELSAGYKMKTISFESYQTIMGDLAELGTVLNVLRSWAQLKQPLPLLQVFQDCILKRIEEFDRILSNMQQQFVGISEDIVVSLLSVETQLRDCARPLRHLAAIIQKLQAEPYAHSFRYLEFLFEDTCVSQMTGDEKLYSFLCNIFFECFQLYLSPLRQWMEDGFLEPSDKVFFVVESSTKSGLSSIWQDRYKLRQSQTGVLHAPSFICPAAGKIFTTGKSVVILKQLGQHKQAKSNNPEPRLTFKAVCPVEYSLAPFAELFNAAFENWIRSKHHQASANLRQILFDNCGLHNALSSVLSTFFMTDGTSSTSFSKHIFEKLDAGDDSWKDSFTLTELAQALYGSSNQIAFDHLKITISRLPKKSLQAANSRATVKPLSIIKPHFHFFWPIRIIIKPDTIPSYQRIFTFLLQMRRTSYTLSRNRIVKDPLTHTSSSSERSLYYSLRARLLWFQQTLYYYVTAIVLDSLSSKLQQDLQAAEDVDSMIAVHSAFVKQATDQALLGSKLELIHKTILKILNLSITLEDAQTENTIAGKKAAAKQQALMDLSMGSLGLHTPKRKAQTTHIRHRNTRRDQDVSESSSNDEDDDFDASLLSPRRDDEDLDLPFNARLKKMRDEFDRSVRFVASGLRGVARVGSADEAKSWDLLADMLEAGIGSDARY